MDMFRIMSRRSVKMIESPLTSIQCGQNNVGSLAEMMSDSESEKRPLLDNTHNNVAESQSNKSSTCSTTMRHRSNDLSALDATLPDPSSPLTSTPIPDGNNGNGIGPVHYTYEELSSGFTCPTCHGLGKIPRGKADDLVALIPYNDERLKPRRTWCYVIVSVLACAIIAGVLCGFLVPKDVNLSVDEVETIHVWLNETTSNMRLQLQMEFSVKNNNFVPIYAQNVSLSAYWSDVIKGTNVTSMPFTVGGRHTNSQMYANVTATFTESFLVSYCSGESPTHVIYMQFVAILQFKLLSQNQQSTMTHYSPVKCASLDGRTKTM